MTLHNMLWFIAGMVVELILGSITFGDSNKGRGFAVRFLRGLKTRLTPLRRNQAHSEHTNQQPKRDH